MEGDAAPTAFRCGSPTQAVREPKPRGDFSCGPCHLLSEKLWQTDITSADSYCVEKPLRRHAMVTPLQIKKQVKQVARSGRWQLAWGPS